MAIGRKVPKCTPVMTSNFTPSDSRIVSRLAIIPFVAPKTPVRGMDRMVKERRLVDAMENAGRGIGTIIKIGSMYEEEDAKRKLYSELTEFVLEAIGEEFIREAVNYAEVIGFTEMLCKEMGGPLLGEIQDYFLEVVVPHFNIMVAPCSSTNQVALSDIQGELVRLCREQPKKAINVINPMVICNETKDKCIAISVTEFVKASNLKLSESHCKALINNVACVQAGCSKKHQAMFLQPDSKLPKYGPIIIKGKGEDKNARLRWAVLMKRSCFKEGDLTAINGAFNTCNWPEKELPEEEEKKEAGEQAHNKENRVEEPTSKKNKVVPAHDMEDKVEEPPSKKNKAGEPAHDKEDEVEEPPSKKNK